ncbi:MAG: HAMP domain-containing sensor histidine kinase [Planctomycetaceae bacterium]
MKLTFKIIALFFAAAAALIATSGYLSIQSEVALFQEELAERHAELALSLAPNLQTLLQRSDSLNFFEQTSYNQKSISQRLVWLDDETDDFTRPLANPAQVNRGRPGELISLPLKLGDGSEFYCSYLPLKSPTGRLAALEICESYARRDAYTQGTLKRTLLQLVGLGIVAVLSVSLVGVRLVGRPLEALLRKTDRAAQGDLLSPLHVKGGDELSELAEALNSMCESLDASQKAAREETSRREAAVEQLRHADRLKTVGRLGAGIAHELGTPLNVIIGRATLIAEGKVTGDDVISSADVIRSEGRRMTKLVEGLLNFARRTPAKRQTCDISKIILETVSLLNSFAAKRGATISTDIQCLNSATCHADCAQLQQVVSNLLMNAVLSRADGASVRIVLSEAVHHNPQEPEKGEQACLVMDVIDDGDGIAESAMPHLFEPFFTTRETGEGTGLGLSIVHGIVTEHGGWISVASEPDCGTTFTVFLPRSVQP